MSLSYRQTISGDARRISRFGLDIDWPTASAVTIEAMTLSFLHCQTH